MTAVNTIHYNLIRQKNTNRVKNQSPEGRSDLVQLKSGIWTCLYML